jgi:acetyltransferase-like isoleucine patch superfamily enzyme
MSWKERIYLIRQRLIQGIGLNQTSIKGRHNKIINHGARTNVTLKIKGDNNYLEIGQGTRLANLTITITGNGHRIILGKNCTYQRGNISIWDSNGELNIGRNTTIEGASFGINEHNNKIMIGEDCMLSNGIRIYVGDFHNILELSTGKRINPAKNISIGNHVWIGAGAIILKGVIIGDSAVIGAGSVVTKEINANCIAAGNPARVVKKNIQWTR